MSRSPLVSGGISAPAATGPPAADVTRPNDHSLIDRDASTIYRRLSYGKTLPRRFPRRAQRGAAPAIVSEAGVLLRWSWRQTARVQHDPYPDLVAAGGLLGAALERRAADLGLDLPTIDRPAGSDA
jgi:hypothetical protein